MSRLNELIKELCPNGVEKVSLGSLMNRIREKNYHNSGIEIVYSVTKENGIVKSDDLHDFNVYSNDLSNYNIIRKNQYAYNPARLNIGSIARLKRDEIGLVSPMYIVFELDKNKIDFEYYEHLLFSEKVFNNMCSFVEQGARFRFDYKNWDKIIIDLPPLQVQKEIAKILNKFIEMQEYLEAELEARKSQYEFWREKLFKNNKVKYMKILEFAKCYAGATPSTSRSEYWDNGTIPWMSSGEVNKIEIYETEKKITELGYNSSSTKILPVDTVVIALAGQGKTRGLVAITRKEVCTNQSLCGIVPDERVNNEYLFYYLQSRYKNLREISSGDGTRGGLNLKMINDYEVPVPDISEQKRVVKILNIFSKLVNSYTEGLPAEIELRRQQYEYYRNKLLSFEELNNG